MNSKNKHLNNRLSWLIIFSIAMAYLESAVVVYLREIYYPEGFAFPLTPIDSTLVYTEFFREIATIIMLVGIGILTGKSSSQRFAFFLITFAIWDIFYYVFLYILLGWPSSLLTWDILFLVPVPWVGPVISPIIVSILMILLASSIIYRKRGLNLVQWMLAIIGSVVIIMSWISDFWSYSREQLEGATWTLSTKEQLFNNSQPYIPTTFNWYPFALGIAILLTATVFHFFGKSRQL